MINNKNDDWVITLWEWANENHLIDLKLDEGYGGYWKGLPRDREKLLELTTLNLMDNKLIELTDNIYKLTNLTELILFNNNLIELPNGISSLTNLTKLYLNKNQLVELPKEISSLTNLTNLSLLENTDLILSLEQKEWILELIKNGCEVKIDKHQLESNVQTRINKNIEHISSKVNKILLIDLDGTLTNTAHIKFKPMKDGAEKIKLENIPIFPGAKEFIEYQKRINNTVIIVSDSHTRYVEKISHEIFKVECISLCDKPNINKIKDFINSNENLKVKFLQDKNKFIFIGDTWLDIEVGRKLNIPTILVEFYQTNSFEIRDAIGNRLKHVHMGATFYANTFKRLIKIIDNPSNNLLALEGIFQFPSLNTIDAIPIKEYMKQGYLTKIVSLGRQQQGECDNYAVTKQYFNIANENRTGLFIQTLSKSIENYINSLALNNYDLITFVTDKKTTKPKNKMKEIFNKINLKIKKEILFEWSTKVDGSLRDRATKGDRKNFINEFLFVKEDLNINKKNIIIIDDQITTGATAEILIEELRKKGAGNIIFIALFSLISNVESEKKCPKCGKNLVIKIKRSDGTKFFSCVIPKYRGNGCGYTENIKNG